MVQHVTIVPKPFEPEKPDAFPQTVSIWRDDQTIKWGLVGNFSWPNPVGPQVVPIQFLPADPDRGYSEWTGSDPAPIGPRPEPGTPDRRFYVATGGTILDPGQPPLKYHYLYAVCPEDSPSCELDIHPPLQAPRSQQRFVEGVWYDPDVENQNRP